MLLKVEKLTKQYHQNYALKDLDLILNAGEVHSLVGENGAGKSTIIKLISGAIKPTSGNILIDGKSRSEVTPLEAISSGIQTVYQEEKLVPQMSIAENLFLAKPSNGVFTNHKFIEQQTQQFFDDLQLDVDVSKLYEDLSLPEQQIVKIVRALFCNPTLLILDEPTAVFDVKEADVVINLIKKVAAQSVAVLFISHHLDEVLEVSDTITVLRDGERVELYENLKVNSGTNGNTTVVLTIQQLAKDMVGANATEINAKIGNHTPTVIPDKPTLSVRDLKLTPTSDAISFDAFDGQILGIAGLIGAGRSELLRAIFGAYTMYSGRIEIDGQRLNIDSPSTAIAAGIGLVTENRSLDGLCMGSSVTENIILPNLTKLKPYSVSQKVCEAESQRLIDQLHLKCSSADQEVAYLSGGNKQKVVLAKWLLNNPEILLVDEPTHAVDINTQTQIHQLLRELADQGKCIIVVSSDMPELLNLSDRILVMRNYSVVAHLQGEQMTKESIINLFMEQH